MQIIPDPTMVVLQVFPFLFTIVVLYFIIFKPMLAYLEDRERAMTEGREEAAALRGQIERRTQQVEQALLTARKEVAQIRARRRHEATAAYEARIQAARVEAEARVEQALAAIREEGVQVRETLRGESQSIANQIAAQVLGRHVATASGPDGGQIHG